LPSPERIAEVELVRSPLSDADAFRERFDARYQRLKVAAEIYFKDRRILTLAYNKTKHGADGAGL